MASNTTGYSSDSSTEIMTGLDTSKSDERFEITNNAEAKMKSSSPALTELLGALNRKLEAACPTDCNDFANELLESFKVHSRGDWDSFTPARREEIENVLTQQQMFFRKISCLSQKYAETRVKVQLWRKRAEESQADNSTIAKAVEAVNLAQKALATKAQELQNMKKDCDTTQRSSAAIAQKIGKNLSTKKGRTTRICSQIIDLDGKLKQTLAELDQLRSGVTIKAVEFLSLKDSWKSKHQRLLTQEKELEADEAEFKKLRDAKEICEGKMADCNHATGDFVDAEVQLELALIKWKDTEAFKAVVDISHVEDQDGSRPKPLFSHAEGAVSSRPEDVLSLGEDEWVS